MTKKVFSGSKKKIELKGSVFLRLVTNNTGVSIKSFMLLWGACISTVIILSILCFEAYLLTHSECSYRPNYIGLSAVIASIGTMVGAVVWGKVKGDSLFDSENSTQSFGTGINKEDSL